MTDSALFIRWGATAGGRERQSVELFAESLRYLTGLVEQGRVASVEPFFLEPSPFSPSREPRGPPLASLPRNFWTAPWIALSDA